MPAEMMLRSNPIWSWPSFAQSESPKLLSYDLPHFSNVVLAGHRGPNWVLHPRRASASLSYSVLAGSGCGSGLYKKPSRESWINWGYDFTLSFLSSIFTATTRNYCEAGIE